jgi:hypothetical protein
VNFTENDQVPKRLSGNRLVSKHVTAASRHRLRQLVDEKAANRRKSQRDAQFRADGRSRDTCRAHILGAGYDRA